MLLCKMAHKKAHSRFPVSLLNQSDCFVVTGRRIAVHHVSRVAVENFNLNNQTYANRKCTTQSLFGDATAKESRHGNRCSSPSRACVQSGWMAEVRWSQKGDRQSCTRKLALKRTFEKGSLLFPKRKLFGDRGLLLW